MDWLDLLAVQGPHTCMLINKFISKEKKEVKGVLTGSWKKASVRQWEQFSNRGLEEFVHHCESFSVMSDSLRTHDYTVHWILQVRILGWVAIPFSRGSSKPRDQTQVSCTAGGFFTFWATKTPGTVSTDPLMVALQGVQVKTHAFRNMTLQILHYHMQNT